MVDNEFLKVVTTEGSTNGEFESSSGPFEASSSCQKRISAFSPAHLVFDEVLRGIKTKCPVSYPERVTWC